MIIFLLGLMDIFAGLMIPLMHYFPSLQILTLVAAALILTKSLLFLDDIASWIDLVAAAFLIFASFNYTNIFSYVMMVWLLQKGIRSFI